MLTFCSAATFFAYISRSVGELISARTFIGFFEIIYPAYISVDINAVFAFV